MKHISFEEFEQICSGKTYLLCLTATEKEQITLHKCLAPINGEDDLLSFEKNSTTYYLGMYGIYLTIHAHCLNMGSLKTDASFHTLSKSLNLFQPKLVLMVGIALGVKDKIDKIGDLLVSEYIINYESAKINEDHQDFRPEIHKVNASLLNIFSNAKSYSFEGEQYKVIKAGILSGEKVVNKKEFLKTLITNFSYAHGGEMEGNGLPPICEEKKIPWLLVKSVCDLGYEKTDEDQDLACQISINFCKDILANEKIFDQFGLTPWIDHEELNAEEILKLVFSNYKITKIPFKIDWKNKIIFEYFQIIEKEFQKTQYHVFMLGKNALIENTIEAISKLSTSFNEPLMIVSPKVNESRIQNIQKKCQEFFSKTKQIKVKSKEELIWSLYGENKIFDEISTIDYYVDQEIKLQNNEYKPALEYFKQNINNLNKTISIILATGGAGKSTLVQALTNEINRNINHKNAIYIDAEKIKPSLMLDKEILSIVDLFEAYNLMNSYQKDSNHFRLNVSCGNSIVIIDGLDEFVSQLKENFNLSEFLNSIEEMNKSDGKVTVIITARDNFKNSVLQFINQSDIYELRGFTKELSLRFFQKRFALQLNKKDLIEKALKEINKLGDHFKNEEGEVVLLPFFIDMLANFTLEVDSLDENSIDQDESPAESKFLDLKNVVDSFILDVLNREQVRQKLQFNIDDMISVLTSIAAEDDGMIDKEKLKFSILVHLGSQYEDKVDTLYLLPLLKEVNNKFIFRYNFLKNYFMDHYVVYNLISSNCNDYVIKILAQNANNMIYSQKIADILRNKFASSDALIASLGKVLRQLVSDMDTESKLKDQKDQKIAIQLRQRAIGSLLYIVIYYYGLTKDKTEKMDVISALYNSTVIKHLYIFGDFFPLDFTNYKIYDSTFFEYSNLSKCTSKTSPVFYNCVFENNKCSHILLENTAFSQCSLNELSYLLDTKSNSQLGKTTNLKNDIKGILEYFFYSNKFQHIKQEFVKYKEKGPMSTKTLLKEMEKYGLLILHNTNTKEYGISPQYQNSIIQLFSNSKWTKELNAFLAELRL